MKQLLIVAVWMFGITALAGNGAGTMGRALSESGDIDLSASSLIRFERVVDHRAIEFSQLVGFDGDVPLIDRVLVEPKDIPQAWKDALRKSSESNSWQLILEHQGE